MTSLRVPDAPRKQATVLGQGAGAVPALVDVLVAARGGLMTVFCLVELDGGAVDGGAAGWRTCRCGRSPWLGSLPPARLTLRDGGGGVAAVVFVGGAPQAERSRRVDPGLVADLAAYGVTDVYAVAGIDGYAPLAWARVLQLS